MPLRGVGASVVATVVFWGAWDWASSDGEPTIGLIAGILLVASAIALAGFAGLALLGLARIGAERAATRRTRARTGTSGGDSGSEAPVEPAPRRIAA
jgi:hypothetical protein